jgi:hypothetical protein
MLRSVVLRARFATPDFDVRIKLDMILLPSFSAIITYTAILECAQLCRFTCTSLYCKRVGQKTDTSGCVEHHALAASRQSMSHPFSRHPHLQNIGSEQIPLGVCSMLLRARAATTDVAVLLEPDVILLPDFSTALAKARGVAGQDWLLLARRWELRNFPFRVEEVFQEEERDFEAVGSDEGSQERESAKRRFRWVDPSRFDAEAEHLWALEFLDGSGNGRGDGSVNGDSDGSLNEEGAEKRYRGGLGGMRAFVRERGALQNCGEVALWAWDTGNTPLHR